VQKWKAGDPDIGAVFEKARHLPDGSRLLTSTGQPEHGGKGAVEWRADSLSSDGLRVSVSELNARAYKLPGARPTPALGIDRLTEIVVNAAWRKAIETPS
jgi:hypothetical protein